MVSETQRGVAASSVKQGTLLHLGYSTLVPTRTGTSVGEPEFCNSKMGPDNIPDDDWEEWDGRSSFVHHMIAGSAAGVAEHLCMYPVDTFKVSCGGELALGAVTQLVFVL